MLYRKIQPYIESYLKSDSNKVLIIDGARQIGKTFIIRHVGQQLFENYIELNFAEDYNGPRLFEQVRTVKDFYFQVSTIAGERMGEKKNTLIFLDEIQAYPHLLTMLKFLKQDDRYTYIASGSLLGVTLVLKRFSFIGDGLSHVAFGAMAVSGVLGLTNDMPLVMAITIVSAVLLLKTGQNRKIQGDAAVAMISVGALALGYLLMNLFSTSGNLSGDVCSTLFGSTSILTLSLEEVWLSVAMSALVVLIFVLFYNKIFAVTFDESFAKAAGTAADRYNLLIAVTVAVVIVLAMNLVGSLLISALVIFPALSAMGVFKSFRSVTICSAVLSTVCAALGILIAILAGTPVGSTIVAVDILAFFLFSGMGRLVGGICQ